MLTIKINVVILTHLILVAPRQPIEYYIIMNLRHIPRALCSPVLPLLFLVWISTPSVWAEISSGLHTGTDTSSFKDVILSEPALGKNPTLKMEALWEMDMSQADNGAGVNDANDNNHNLLIVDDMLYVYIERYDNTEPLYIRRFKLNDGKCEPPLSASFTDSFANSEIKRMLLSDDDGNLALVGLKANANPPKGMHLIIQIFNPELELIKTLKFEEDAQDGCHYFKGDYEWLGCQGSFLNGEFEFSIGCWHNFGDAIDSKFLPTKCDFKISGDDKLDITTTKYLTGEYPLETRKYHTIGHSCRGLLYVVELSENKHLVQSFSTYESSAPNVDHSPLLLYKTGESSMMEQCGYLQDEMFRSSDAHCFGAFPANIGNIDLLILPYKFNETDGVKFKVASWNNHDFNTLTELWEFPSQKVFPQETTTLFKNVFEFARPKVVIAPGTPSSKANRQEEDVEVAASTPAEATVYAYMPGSLLGAYKISLDDNPIPSGIIYAASTAADLQIEYNLTGKTLEISAADTDLPVNLSIYASDGKLRYCETIPTANNAKISLGHLSDGIYILKLNQRYYKIALH